MSKTPRKPSGQKPKEIEAEPGTWDRFEHAVDAAVKSGPKHRATKPKTASAKKAVQRRD